MGSRCRRIIGACVLPLLAAFAVHGQEAAPAKPAAPAPNPARDLTMSKCFQCHTDTMWRDQRQGTRAWEATLYRMVARGAVWSDEDIKTMASFLAADFGPQSPRAKPATTPR